MIKKFILMIAMVLAAAVFVFGDNGAAANAHTGVDTNVAVSVVDTGINASGAGASASVRSGVAKACIIPVSGTVDHGMAAFVGRSLREAGRGDNTLVILEIDTFGGQLDAALSIVDSILACKAPTIAFVRSKAISAGALIAFAADMIVMRPSATIGDVAPIVNASDGPKTLGEKHQSPIRAKFRALASRNGYPQILSEAMVTEELAVFEVVFPDTVMYLDSVRIADLDPAVKASIKSTKTIVKSGELLTMTEAEALKYGFSRMTASSIDEMLKSMDYNDLEIITIGRNWSERLVSVIAMLAPVLMMLGFSAIYIEMRSPGFGIPGLIGIICLALVFFGQYMVGLADHTELLLLVTGAVLLAMEIFVLPGFGVAGFLGISLMIVGMLLSFQNFVFPSPEFPWQTGVLKANIMRVSLSVIGAIVLILLFFKYGIEHVGKVIKGPYLSATLADARSDEGMAFVPKVGDRGITSTSLRPSGKVTIDRNLCDVVTDGQFVDSGIPVIVTQIQGNRIVVAAESLRT